MANHLSECGWRLPPSWINSLGARACSLAPFLAPPSFLFFWSLYMCRFPLNPSFDIYIYLLIYLYMYIYICLSYRPGHVGRGESRWCCEDPFCVAMVVFSLFCLLSFGCGCIVVRLLLCFSLSFSGLKVNSANAVGTYRPHDDCFEGRGSFLRAPIGIWIWPVHEILPLPKVLLYIYIPCRGSMGTGDILWLWHTSRDR